MSSAVDLGRQEVDDGFISGDGTPGITATNTNTNKTQNYKLFYFGDTRTAQVLPVDSAGEILIDAKPIYTNGVWDTTQFSGIDPNVQNVIHGKVQTAIRSHTNKTNIPVPQWASADMQGYPPDYTANQIAQNIYTGEAAGTGDHWFYDNPIVTAVTVVHI